VLKEKYILFQADFYRPSNAATSARLDARSMPPNRVHLTERCVTRASEFLLSG
jgi:hypothetical protein